MIKLPQKYPSKGQWVLFFKNPHRFLPGWEKPVFWILTGLLITSFLFLVFNFYFKNTTLLPAYGGAFVEGLLGQPRFINPIYAAASDTDRDIAQLLFSGLLKYDQQGKIVPDLAENYEIKEGGKVYEVRLKQNLFWSDGQPLRAEDVVFTIETIQNSDYKSPLQVLWLGVVVEKISDLDVRFTLRTPYGPFLENLTQKIIPEHIFKEVSPENFSLTTHNLRPVGSGPYKLDKLKQEKGGRITFLTLVRNERYFDQTPLISKISFRFYNKEEELLLGYQKGEVDGFVLSSHENSRLNSLKELKKYALSMPRYFALFFNPSASKPLLELAVRQALNYGTNKEEILQEVLAGQGKQVTSPVLPEIYGLSSPSKIYEFDQDKAKEMLEGAGFLEQEDGLRVKTLQKTAAFQFKRDLRVGSQGQEVQELQKCLAQDKTVYSQGEVTGYFGEQTKQAVIRFQEKYAKDILAPWGFDQGTGLVSRTTRNKLNELCFPQASETLPLKFFLSTLNQPDLLKTAQIIAEQWSKLGVQVQVLPFDISRLEKEVIKPRNYDILLFGQVLTTIPDPFAFWHSGQIKDPGLNLANFQQKTADKLLEDNRQAMEWELRQEKLELFQEVVLENSPAVFLYNPDYLYFVSTNIKGIGDHQVIADPSKRFSGIEQWYIKQRKAWKF